MPAIRGAVARRSLATACGAMALLACLLLGACAEPAPRLWSRWTAHDESNHAPIDHHVWQAFLTRYVQPQTPGRERLAYAAVTAADRARLDGYLHYLQQIPVSRYPLREQRAYWLNLYNARVVQLVLQHWPMQSLDVLQPGWLARTPGPFAAATLQVEAQAVSLDDIENRILRPYWGDPRTLYALCPARVGAPSLGAEAYTAEYLDEQLEARARAWVNGPQALHWHGSALRLAALYRRDAADFGAGSDAVLQHLRRYAAPALAQRLATVRGIDGYDDDPAINRAE